MSEAVRNMQSPESDDSQFSCPETSQPAQAEGYEYVTVIDSTNKPIDKSMPTGLVLETPRLLPDIKVGEPIDLRGPIAAPPEVWITITDKLPEPNILTDHV